MKRAWKVAAIGLCAVLALFLNAGCATSKTASDSTPQTGAVGQMRYVVTADFTSFYKNGPAQPGGPDLKLKKDDVVTLLDRHYGYSRVTNADGDAGYVSTEDIGPAPNQAPVLATGAKKGGRNQAPLAPADYNDQPNDSPLPSRQPPSEQPAPSFRY